MVNNRATFGEFCFNTESWASFWPASAQHTETAQEKYINIQKWFWLFKCSLIVNMIFCNRCLMSIGFCTVCLELCHVFTYLVELEKLLFEFVSLGLLAVSPEPLHPVSAPVWSLRAHWRTLQGGQTEDKERGERAELNYESTSSVFPFVLVRSLPSSFLTALVKRLWWDVCTEPKGY